MDSYYLGIDLGSSYTKFVVINEWKKIVFSDVIKSLRRNKNDEELIKQEIKDKFNVVQSCVTGYGRINYKNSNLTKTELFSASVALNEITSENKIIIDIGGEDIKIIESDKDGKVRDFYMNTKCAAGTGSFITETCEKADIEISEMSTLAEMSSINYELNSFCTVFAKTEVMMWLIEGKKIEDIAKGIYISVINRIKKLPVKINGKVYLIGGVASYHPYFPKLLSEMLKVDVRVPENPQYINAFGAAIYAYNEYNK